MAVTQPGRRAAVPRGHHELCALLLGDLPPVDRAWTGPDLRQFVAEAAKVGSDRDESGQRAKFELNLGPIRPNSTQIW